MIPTLQSEPMPFVPPLGLAEEGLHQLDYQDIAISAEALRIVRAAGQALFERCLPGGPQVAPAHALSMFLDRVIFNERTGELLMCADVPGSNVCLPIPKGHWGMRNKGRLQ
ncbi:hypothetical protein dsx2_1690 [Desulfovibrio sp. X2]|uniref:hypothetical protein n=1 Tax=Desulfovibrio sp. X2 TaxID=941449 RepID=UPI000358CFDA|nr:hypothetical protein [Desulfovibrio sp. X2]EPR44329.1 hypothetical protein dsx2_1690 [Desulfovibrio sp. X2]